MRTTYKNEDNPAKLQIKDRFKPNCKLIKKNINIMSFKGKANLSHWKSSQDIIFTYLNDK